MFGRTCGGYKDFSQLSIVLRYNKEKYETIEDWLESFPHIYFSFYPDAVITLYPRDYVYNDSGEDYHLGFDRLDSRIILGGVFMRNYDIQFNRQNQTVSIVRSECSKGPAGFDFGQYYFHHKDDHHYQKVKEDVTEQNNKEDSQMSPLVRVVIIVLAIMIFTSVGIYFLWTRRFDRYEGNNQIRIGGSEYRPGQIEPIHQNEMNRTEESIPAAHQTLDTSIEV